MKKLNFLYLKKILIKTEVKNKIYINVFCYKSKLTYQICISNQKFQNSMDLSIISDKIMSHSVHIKFLTNLCLIKQQQKTFVNIVYSVLAVKVF